MPVRLGLRKITLPGVRRRAALETSEALATPRLARMAKPEQVIGRITFARQLYSRDLCCHLIVALD